MVTRDKKKPKPQLSWIDVKEKVAEFDRAGLLSLVQDLYALNKTNQSFLHARFSLGADALTAYKKLIHDALFPGWNKPVRIAEAKRAITEYRRAIGRPEDLLELHVFWCETGSGFSMEFGYADEGYFDALMHQFEAAIEQLGAVDETIRQTTIKRLKGVRDRTEVGYGVQDEMTWLLNRAGLASLTFVGIPSLAAGKSCGWSSGIRTSWIWKYPAILRSGRMVRGVSVRVGAGESCNRIIGERIELSWTGHDEIDDACGRGWAIIQEGELRGHIFFQLGDDSAFRAVRARRRVEVF